MLKKNLLHLNLGGQAYLGLRLGIISLLLAGLCLASFSLPITAQADPFAAPAFERNWARADLPVVTQTVQRGYTWGQLPFYTTYEAYDEAPEQRRLVQYFDKARMEITRPALDISTTGPFYVTNGLLAKELILGTLQTGDNRYVSRIPAFDIPVAGDPIEVNGEAPTYASFFNLSAASLPSGFLSLPNPRSCNNSSATGPQCSSNIRTNEPVVDTINKDGSVGRSVGLGTIPGARYVYYDRTLKHNIPLAFWDYLNQSGIVFDGHGYSSGKLFDWISAFGYPLTDAYWVSTRVGGVLKNVMVQIFERRVLTFTPGNPPGYEVEMGNIGKHYYQWRYTAKYDIPIPICAFCRINPQAGFPGATFVIVTEPIFLDLNLSPEPINYALTRPDGKIFTSFTGTDFTGTLSITDPGRVRAAITTTSLSQRGLYTLTITGLISTQQAKAFFYVIDIPGVPTNLV